MRECERLPADAMAAKDAAGRRTQAIGVGELHLLIETNEGETLLITLKNVCHTPGFASAISSKLSRAQNQLDCHASEGKPGTCETRSNIVFHTHASENGLDWITGQAMPEDVKLAQGAVLNVQQDTMTLPTDMCHSTEEHEAHREGQVSVQEMNKASHEELMAGEPAGDQQDDLVFGFLPKQDYVASRRFCIATEMERGKHYVVSSNS